jgi:hypothetical protein
LSCDQTNIHKIVDGIQNEQLLETIYDFLKVRQTDKSGRLWDSLTKEQKQEILLAYDESDDENNLIEKEKAFKRTK